eukprot:GSA25T00008821001.1
MATGPSRRNARAAAAWKMMGELLDGEYFYFSSTTEQREGIKSSTRTVGAELRHLRAFLEAYAGAASKKTMEFYARSTDSGGAAGCSFIDGVLAALLNLREALLSAADENYGMLGEHADERPLKRRKSAPDKTESVLQKSNDLNTRTSLGKYLWAFIPLPRIWETVLENGTMAQLQSLLEIVLDVKASIKPSRSTQSERSNNEARSASSSPSSASKGSEILST